MDLGYRNRNIHVGIHDTHVGNILLIYMNYNELHQCDYSLHWPRVYLQIQVHSVVYACHSTVLEYTYSKSSSSSDLRCCHNIDLNFLSIQLRDAELIMSKSIVNKFLRLEECFMTLLVLQHNLASI